MSRISDRLNELQAAGRKALIPYLVAGDPDKNVTVAAMHAFVDAGADIIELGVPFSDPMAEGPVIQRAHERALERNTSLNDALHMVKEFRDSNQHTAVLLMGCANPIERMSYQTFCDKAVDAGLDAVLTVDLPPEEAEEFNGLMRAHGLDTIYLLSPTTSDARARSIASMATGFLYYVSLKGVTGAGTLDLDTVSQKIAEIKGFAKLPVCVGFGIKDAVSAKRLATVADGVVVGSALVELLGRGDAGLIHAEHLIKEMREAIDSI